MKDRVQVADLSLAQLRPEARGGDTYFRPQAEAVQQQADPMLAQLAEGLGKLQPKLMELGMQYLDKENKREQAEGNQAYREALMKDAELNKKGFKDLVDQGVIPAGASPWFQKGWREQQLRNMGEEYGRDVTLTWNANGDLKNSDGPASLATASGWTKPLGSACPAFTRARSKSSLKRLNSPAIFSPNGICHDGLIPEIDVPSKRGLPPAPWSNSGQQSVCPIREPVTTIALTSFGWWGAFFDLGTCGGNVWGNAKSKAARALFLRAN